MSGTATWLHTQRKTELVELANKVGLKGSHDMKKADLETALDAHMRANQTILSKDSSLAPYYKRVDGASPAASKEIAVVATKTPKARRPTKSREEIEAESGASSALARTPKAKLPLAANIPLPPSPAVVAGHIDRQTARVRSRLNKAYKQSGIVEQTDSVRDFVSSTAGIESLVTLAELYGLHYYLVPWKSVFEVPASYNVLSGTSFSVSLPDFFNVLQADFWSVLMTWALTNLIVPYTLAYFFNMTLKAKQGTIKSTKPAPAYAANYDHLTFNVAKALVAYVVYSQHFQVLGLPTLHSTGIIKQQLIGGYNGIMIGSAIGTLTSLYEAVLRK